MAQACNCGDSPNGAVKPPPTTPTLQRQVSGIFIDAATGAPITAPLAVKVFDADIATASRYSQDALGKPVNAFTVSSGMLSFQVDPSVGVPHKLTIVGRAAGYDAASASVTILGDGAQSFVARMVNVSHPPPGVSTVRTALGTGDSNGRLTGAATVCTPPDGSAGCTVQLSFLAGTGITAADGAPLTGQLTASLSCFNNLDASSLDAFPGGLAVAVPIKNLGVVEGAFVSGGFAAIEITDAAGHQAAHFSQPVALKLSVPATTVDPEKKRTVQAGDSLQFWSYDEVNGQWSSEPDLFLTGSAPNLDANGALTHLSYFNLDWLRGACPPVTVHVTGNPQGLRLGFEVKGRDPGYDVKGDSTGGDANTVVLSSLPDVPLSVIASLQGQQVGKLDLDNACHNETFELPVTLPRVTAADLEVVVEQVCQEDRSVKVPVGSAALALYTGGGQPSLTVTNADGQASFGGLVSGATYDLQSVIPVNGLYTGVQKSVVVLHDGRNELEVQHLVSCALTGITGTGGESR